MSKTNLGLVKYAKAQLGKPYWYGCFGQTSTEGLYKTKKAQYPRFYTATNFMSQLGVKVHDCIGLIKGYIWSTSETDGSPKYASNGCPDVNEEMMYNAAKTKGTISSMPDIPGICVLLPGHIGVYIGNGEVIEARGHAYGVVKTKLKGRGWTKWCKCPYITYTEKKKVSKPATKKTSEKTKTLELPKLPVNGCLKRGSKGEEVKKLQAILNRVLNAKLEVDGKYGPLTESAVKALQKKLGLVEDGKFGPKSLAATKKLKI